MLPFFSPIRGIWSHRGLCQRRLGHGAIDALPDPCDAVEFVVFDETGPPEAFEEPVRLPFQEIAVNGARTPEPLFGERLPLDACSQDEHDAGEDLPRRQGFAPGPRLAAIFTGRIAFRRGNQRLDLSPKVGGNFP